MATAIYHAEQAWLTRNQVISNALVAFAEWKDDDLIALYMHETGDTDAAELDRTEMMEYLAVEYATAYERMAEIVDDTYATIRLGDVCIVHFAGDDYDPTAWDDVSLLFHYRDFGTLPTDLDPTLVASDEAYIPGGANCTANPAFLDAFRHTARTHPDPAVRLAVITDPLMPWTVDDLITFAQDPAEQVRTAATSLVITAAT